MMTEDEKKERWARHSAIIGVFMAAVVMLVLIGTFMLLVSPIMIDSFRAYEANMSQECNICLNGQGQSNLTPLTYFGENMNNKTLYNACTKNCTLVLENTLS